MVNPDSVREQVVPDARQNPDERRMAAWIGKSLLVQGKIVSTEDLTIHGGVEGTIELGDHSLTIGDGAAIKADLVAKIIHISGTTSAAPSPATSWRRSRSTSKQPPRSPETLPRLS